MRFLADENFDGDVLKALRQKNPELDIVRVQDTEIFHADDPTVLAWAAKEQRILLTYDVHTMIGFAYARVNAGLPMPGVIEVVRDTPIGQTIEELLTVIGAGSPEDFENQVRFIPLR